MVSPSLTLLRTQTDERLIALARAGHERAFEAIVERYRRPLHRHARRLMSDARAEEAVQQALVAAWTALRRGDDVRHLSGWLHRIVHNATLNVLRGERDDYAELREWVEASGAPEDELERREMLRETLANLGALPERQREALLRVAVDGVSAEEVGSALGLTEGAVRQLLYRARTALRAAATALTPMPVASWLARAEPLTARIAEAAGAGSAGLGTVLAKTGVVVVAAGGAAAGPAVLDDGPRNEPSRDRAAQSDPGPRSPVTEFRTIAPVPAGATFDDRLVERSGDSGRGSSGSGSSGSGTSGSGTSVSGTSGSGSSGSGSGGSGDSGSGTSGSGSSGSDLSGSGTSGSGTSGSGTSSSGTSGSNTLVADDSGSGSSGSGSSGSGTSGSTTVVADGSGSASRGSGTSGSGSSGSGSE